MSAVFLVACLYSAYVSCDRGEGAWCVFGLSELLGKATTSHAFIDWAFVGVRHFVFMYVCMYSYVCVCVCMYVCTRMYTLYVRLCMSRCMFASAYIRLEIVSVPVVVFVCLFVRLFVCILLNLFCFLSKLLRFCRAQVDWTIERTN